MKRKTYPLRINPEILEAMQKWANDDLRSVNAQIEFVLRESLIKAGRFKSQTVKTAGTAGIVGTAGSAGNESAENTEESEKNQSR